MRTLSLFSTSRNLRQMQGRLLVVSRVPRRGFTTHHGAVIGSQKTHADIICQLQRSKCEQKPSQDVADSQVVFRHGSHLFNVLPKQCHNSRALHTNLAPRSVAHSSLRETAVMCAGAQTENKRDVRNECTAQKFKLGRLVKPYVEQNEVLKQRHEKTFNFCKETLRALSVQELDKLFNVVSCSRLVSERRNSSETDTKMPQSPAAPAPAPASHSYTEPHPAVLSPSDKLMEIVDLLTRHSQKFDAVWQHVNLQLLQRSVALALKPGYWHENAETPRPPEPRSAEQVVSAVKAALANAKVCRHSFPENIMHCMGTDAAGPLEPPKPEEPQSNDRPNKDQLQGVRDHFAQAIVTLTKKKQKFQYITPDVILENNYTDPPEVKQGIKDLVFQVMRLRWKMEFHFLTHGIHVEGSSINERDGSVCLHWMIAGIGFKWRRVFMVWRWIPWAYKRTQETHQERYEGLITLWVNSQGEVYKMRIDKLVVDPYGAQEKKPSLAEKLSGAVPV